MSPSDSALVTGERVGDESVEVAGAPPSWSWLFQRLSGLLLVLLAGWFVADRYVLAGTDPYTALDVSRRWSNQWWRLADFAFVVVATGHVLVGLHHFVRRHLGSTGSAAAVEIAGGVIVVLLALRAGWVVATF